MWEWFKNLVGVKRVCPDCGGRGKWQETVLGSDGLMHVDTHYCETCHGTGIKVNDDDIDDFDLAGVGVTEHDDDEL